jgi:hypothetical protein
MLIRGLILVLKVTLGMMIAVRTTILLKALGGRKELLGMQQLLLLLLRRR